MEEKIAIIQSYSLLQQHCDSIGIDKELQRRSTNLHDSHRLLHSYKNICTQKSRRGTNLHELSRLFHNYENIGIKKLRRGNQFA